MNPLEALASRGKLDHVDATWVLPGHGEVAGDGLADALRLIRAHASPPPRTVTPGDAIPRA